MENRMVQDISRTENLENLLINLSRSSSVAMKFLARNIKEMASDRPVNELLCSAIRINDIYKNDPLYEDKIKKEFIEAKKALKILEKFCEIKSIIRILEGMAAFLGQAGLEKNMARIALLNNTIFKESDDIKSFESFLNDIDQDKEFSKSVKKLHDIFTFAENNFSPKETRRISLEFARMSEYLRQKKIEEKKEFAVKNRNDIKILIQQLIGEFGS